MKAPAPWSGPASGALTFLLSGTIEPRKGQDLLVEAVGLLPEHVRAACRFLMTGKLWELHHEFWRAIEANMARLPEVSYLGLRDHRAQLELIAGSDVIVCASRDEPWSLVVVEAAMASKPSILNEHVGAAEMFDAESCFMFESGSALSLAGELLAAYERRGELARMGQAARRTFERDLTLEAFGRRFSAMLARQLALGALRAPRAARASTERA